MTNKTAAIHIKQLGVKPKELREHNAESLPDLNHPIYLKMMFIQLQPGSHQFQQELALCKWSKHNCEA